MENIIEQQEQIRVRVWVSGKVQRVGYRFYTMNEANQLGISGWVRNLSDRRVEAVLEGNQPAVEAMIRWCHQGPPGAVVQDVKVEYEVPENLRGFKIITDD